MPTLSKKQLRGGGYRMEASVASSVHQAIQSLTLQRGASNIGEAVDYLTQKAIEDGFEAGFVCTNTGELPPPAQLAQVYDRALDRLLLKYEHDALKQAVLLELVSEINAEKQVPYTDQIQLIDTVVNKETHDFFKRMSKQLGHKASKAKLLSSLVTFSQ
jgi:hypothetical protein